MKKYNWIFAAICFVIAALLAVLPMPFRGLCMTMRVLSLPVMVGAMLFAVSAIANSTPKVQFAQEKAQLNRVPGHVPAPPMIPQEFPLEQKVTGSLRGALTAMGKIQDTFNKSPMLAWQFERVMVACKSILETVETEGVDAGQAADFAVQYLPSAMQYIMACQREGCPENVVKTMARIAVACERQQDALLRGEYVTFEQEYYALRTDLYNAAFRWDV